MSQLPNNNKYYAFISYSHRDDGWGAWLHKSLEAYRPPKVLIGKSNRDGKVPAKLAPVFQDVHELPTASDLGAMIKSALEQSLYLIVICSPASAKSIWVNEEILTYKRLGKADHILAIIVDGEPNATEMPGMEDQECFPPALRFQLDDDGNLSNQPAEPIAADARKDKGGKKNALMKLVAGLLGVNFDDLVQREKQRQKKRRIAMAAVVFGVLIGSSLVWNNFQQEQQKAEQAKIDNLTTEAIKALDTSEPQVALKKLSEAMPANSIDIEAPELQRSFAVLNRANFRQKELSSKKIDSAIIGMQILNDGTLLAQNRRGDVQLFNEESELLNNFKGVDNKGNLYETNYHLNKAQTVLTLSTINNKGIPSEKWGTIYADFFVSKTYDLTTGKLTHEVDKRLDDLPGNSSISNSRTDNYYPDDGQYYMALLSEYGEKDTVKSRIIKIDTQTGNYKTWLSVDAYIRSLKYIDGIGVVTETKINSDAHKHTSGLRFARPGDKTLTELLPDNTVNACNSRNNVELEELEGKTVNNIRYGVNQESNALILLTTDISGNSDHCLKHWDIKSLSVSGFIPLKDIKAINANEMQLAKQVLKLDEPLYKSDERGNFSSLINKSTFALSSDLKTFIFTQSSQPTIFTRLRTGNNTHVEGHTAEITSLALNDNSGILYSAAEDMTLRTWDIEPSVNIGSTGLDYINTIQVSKHSLVADAEEDTLDANGNRPISYVIFPASNEAGKFDFTRPVRINIAVGKKKQVESRLLIQGKRLGVVINKPLRGFRIVSEDEPSPPPPQKSRFYLYDNQTGEQLADIQNDLGTYDYPAVQDDTAYFPIDSQLLAVNLVDGSSKRITLTDGYSVKQVLTHGEGVLVIADNNEDMEPTKRIHRIYQFAPDSSAKPVMIAEHLSQEIQYQQSTNQKRTLIYWNDSNFKNNLSVITENGKEYKVTKGWENTFSPKYLISDDKDIIYVINNNKSVTAYNFNGESMGVTYSSHSWFRARLFNNEQYVHDAESFLGLEGKFTCDKLAQSEGYINVSINGKYIRDGHDYVGGYIYDMDLCEVINDLSVNPSNDQAHISDDGLFTYTNRGDIVQLKIKQTTTENIENLMRWRKQQAATGSAAISEKGQAK